MGRRRTDKSSNATTPPASSLSNQDQPTHPFQTQKDGKLRGRGSFPSDSRRAPENDHLRQKQIKAPRGRKATTQPETKENAQNAPSKNKKEQNNHRKPEPMHSQETLQPQQNSQKAKKKKEREKEGGEAHTTKTNTTKSQTTQGKLEKQDS